MPFVVAYLLTVASVLAAVAAFVAVVQIRNRFVTSLAEGANIVANPLATISHHLRGLGAATLDAIPESSFAPGALRRIVYLTTFALLTLSDLTITAERLAALYGLKPLALPFDVAWAGAISWILSAGFFAAAFFELSDEEHSHPWDDLRPGTRSLVRWTSAGMFIVVAISGATLWLWGALAAAGSYPLLPVLIFMTSLGLALTIAAGVSFWAAHDAWSTLFGVLLILTALLIRIVAYLPEAIVISIRRSTYFTMAACDVFFLGVAEPLLRWLASSRLGKALGLPPLEEEPIDWPAIGVVELPAVRIREDEEASDDRKVVSLPRFARRLFNEERAA